MTKYLLLLLLFSSFTYGQQSSMKALPNKIYLFSEAHFIKEKYDEMKIFIFECLDTVSSGEKVTMYFELPTSLNYAFNRMQEHKDTTVFMNGSIIYIKGKINRLHTFG